MRYKHKISFLRTEALSHVGPLVGSWLASHFIYNGLLKLKYRDVFFISIFYYIIFHYNQAFSFSTILSKA